MRRRILGSSSNNTLDTNGYKYVDMGPAGLWATCNVGAEKPEDYGLYFAWGETTGYAQPSDKPGGFVWNTAPYWVSGTYANSKWSKYTPTDSYSSTGIADGKTVLDLEDDAAYVNMGGNWRMPTMEEWVELVNACETTWETDYNGTGIAGRLFKLKTDSSKELFFPAAGIISDGVLSSVGTRTDVWSSQLRVATPQTAYCCAMTSTVNPQNFFYRPDGRSVRAVLSRI